MIDIHDREDRLFELVHGVLVEKTMGSTTSERRAASGATAHQLMAMFGWDSIRQAEHYTRKASQEKLASRAMHLLASQYEKTR